MDYTFSEGYANNPVLEEGQVKVAILRRSGLAIALANAGELAIKEICEQLGCSRSTYYRQVAPKLEADTRR